MTDLLADQARLGASDTVTATRMVLDTSVLISDPDSITAFPGADTVIPLVVVEELDQHKSRMDDVGRAARAVIRAIEELRMANGGDIRTPVALPNGGTLRIETNGLHLNEIREHGLDPTKNDNRILAASLGQAVHGRTIVVSNDAALRIKAAQLGLEAIEHQRLRGRSLFERPVGWHTIEVSSRSVDLVYSSPNGIGIDELDEGDVARVRCELTDRYAVLRSGSQSALVRHQDGELTAMLRVPEPWGLRPRSKEQQFALDLLLDPDIRIVALTERRSHADARAVLEELTERDKLSLEAVTYLRGRSLHGTFVLVDEAQNLEPTTLKTILTRVGEGTKVVFTGDTSQIDAPYLSEYNNAVSVLIDAFDGERCFGHVRLSHCERSEVASLAALRL